MLNEQSHVDPFEVTKLKENEQTENKNVWMNFHVGREQREHT